MIWDAMPNKLADKNMNGSLDVWLMNNLSDERTDIEFGIICSHLWKQRNEEVLDGRGFSKNGLISMINAWLSICWHACQNDQKVKAGTQVNRSCAQEGWEPPHEGWIQIQYDGSVNAHNGIAAVGGLLRDHLGRCKGAFIRNLDSYSITAAELKGVAEGLNMAWDKGHRKVQLNLDSTTTISVIKGSLNDSHRHGNFAIQLRNLPSLDWDVVFSHVFREANFATDFYWQKKVILIILGHISSMCTTMNLVNGFTTM
ncbi:unnamed protein product [Linum trigynum]|uniref:RNase H type-1 domain-containing protein n=1 Tax=Linum trigynum TaxID=586398 RepID=A0AAV2GYX0_9ROSI